MPGLILVQRQREETHLVVAWPIFFASRAGPKGRNSLGRRSIVLRDASGSRGRRALGDFRLFGLSNRPAGSP